MKLRCRVQSRQVKSASRPSVAHKVSLRGTDSSWIQSVKNHIFIKTWSLSTSSTRRSDPLPASVSAHVVKTLICCVEFKQAGFPTFFMIESRIKEETSGPENVKLGFLWRQLIKPRERGVSLRGEEMEWGRGGQDAGKSQGDTLKDVTFHFQNSKQDVGFGADLACVDGVKESCDGDSAADKEAELDRWHTECETVWRNVCVLDRSSAAADSRFTV